MCIRSRKSVRLRKLQKFSREINSLNNFFTITKTVTLTKFLSKRCGKTKIYPCCLKIFREINFHSKIVKKAISRIFFSPFFLIVREIPKFQFCVSVISTAQCGKMEYFRQNIYLVKTLVWVNSQC